MIDILMITLADALAIIKIADHQNLWLAGDYALEIGLFKVASMVITWWIMAFDAVQ